MEQKTKIKKVISEEKNITKEASNVVEEKLEMNEVVVKGKKNQKEEVEKFYLDPIKMIYMWPAVARIKSKAKKIIKKNRKVPGTYSEEYCYNWVKKVVNRLMYVSNIDIKVEGIENWLDKGVVLVPNHQSNIDPLVLLAINDFSLQQPLAFIAKKELWESKSMKNFVRLIDCVPLDRNNPRSALEAFKDAKELVVDYKRSLVIFPEGTRSGSQEVGKFHSASLKVAQMANAPVVPVSIINSYKATKENRDKNSKRLVIKVIFGKPIMGTKHISLKTEDLTKNVRKEVIANLQEWKNKEPSMELRKPKKEKKVAKKSKEKKSLKDLFKIVD